MTSSVFNERYQRLNAKQKEAVDTIEGPVMVIAGPGTGKTTILTLRIANILKQTDTPPSGILAITFTDAGVKAMRQKLKEVIGERAFEVRIHTFHNFAASVISEFRDHFVHLDRANELSEVEALNYIREILQVEKLSDLRPFGNPDFYVTKIISAISDAKREAYTPDMIRSFVAAEIERIKKDEQSYATRGKTKGGLKAEAEKCIEKGERTLVFADVYEAYEAKKKEQRKMDFDDLINELLFGLKRDELLLRMLQEKFLYILVDEHQDTNNSQNELIKQLADFFDVPNIFIVGDEKQAIYRFQGASVENFLTFEKTWKEMKIIHLEDNYRSHQKILDASFSMIEHNYVEDEYKHLRVQLKASGNEAPRPIEVVKAGNTDAALHHMVHAIKEITSKEPTSSVAIIAKTNRDVERIIHICESNGIDVSSLRSIDIFNHPVGTLFFDIVTFLLHPEQSELLAKTLAAQLWKLPFDESLSLIKNIRAGKLTEIPAKIPGLVSLQNKLTSDDPLGFLVHLTVESNLQAVIVKEPSYIEVWRGIVALSENIIQEGNVEESRALLERLVAYRNSAEMRSIKVDIGHERLQVQVMTAHGSKGLEFDYVFIPFATEESWIGRNWGSFFLLPRTRASHEIADIRRLFYVALTRARKHVSILYGEEDHGVLFSPLRFIDELDSSQTTVVSLPARVVKDTTFSVHTKHNEKTKRFQTFTKRVLTESGLSVTALNNFIECPSLFLFSSILKLPQAPSATAEKGNAMHDALHRLWLLENKTLPTLEATLISSILTYFESSYLPLFEKEVLKKELLLDAPVVIRDLSTHFLQKGTVFSENWSEFDFTTDIDNESLTIPLHGKLDLIVDTTTEVRVFDYKTKQAMSENEIRGLTKNSTGAYFRQLVFYKLLLNNDSRFTKRDIIPSLVFVVPDAKGKCPIVTFPITEADTKKLTDELTTLFTSVWSGDFLTATCNDKKCEWCRLKEIALRD